MASVHSNSVRSEAQIFEQTCDFLYVDRRRILRNFQKKTILYRYYLVRLFSTVWVAHFDSHYHAISILGMNHVQLYIMKPIIFFVVTIEVSREKRTKGCPFEKLEGRLKRFLHDGFCISNHECPC